VELYQKALAAKIRRVQIQRGYQRYWFEGDTSLNYVMSFYIRQEPDSVELGAFWIRRGDSLIKEADSDSILAVHEGRRIKFRLLFAPGEQKEVFELKRQKGQN
jgi:hypothetical protein